MKFQNVKGTKDYYPEEKRIFNWIKDKCSETAFRYNFQEMESPAFEYLSLLCEKEGEETKDQIFVLEKRSKEQLGLRFDITVPAARMYISKQKAITKPVKWFYITRMWRYEQPQKGRSREFYQFGVELFGSKNAEADAEVISLAIDTLRAMGLEKKDFRVKINNKYLLQGIVEGLGIGNVEEVITIIDKISKISNAAFVEGLEEAGLNQKQIKELQKLLKTDIDNLKGLNEEATKGLKELREVLKLLPSEFIEVDLSVARGLAYYTGTVFEIFDKDMKYRALCGGGRYDNMIELFGGEPEPATGFGMGFDTLSLYLNEKMKIPPLDDGVEYYLVSVNDEVREEVKKIADKLREKYSVDLDLLGRKMGKQLEYANKIKAKNVIVIGPDEIKKGEVKVKDMSSGKEKKVKIKSL